MMGMGWWARIARLGWTKLKRGWSITFNILKFAASAGFLLMFVVGAIQQFFPKPPKGFISGSFVYFSKPGEEKFPLVLDKKCLDDVIAATNAQGYEARAKGNSVLATCVIYVDNDQIGVMQAWERWSGYSEVKIPEKYGASVFIAETKWIRPI